jgi:SAM-dependent methyltransferase
MDADGIRKEQEHFDHAAESEGVSWWGAGTPAGLLRTERRAGLVRNAMRAGRDQVVLDIGCGSGEMSQHLAGHFKCVVAVDVSFGLLKIFNRRLAGCAVACLLADAERLPFREGAFDGICGNNILHHLELDAILPVCRRYLKPGGRLAFAEPNLVNPQMWFENKIAFVRRRREYSPDEMPFTRWHILRKLREHGFVNARTVPFDFLHPSTPPGWIACVEALGQFLERMPLMREFAGSLIISAEAPKNQKLKTL